jgi:xylulokinase
VSLLGIDIGTTGCKAAAFSEEGECLTAAYREYPTLYARPGWAELDSRHVWSQVEEIISEVAAGTRDDPISALCTSSMGEAMVPVTTERQILGNSILCSDTRGEPYVEQLKRRISQEEFYAINPNILGPNYSLPVLLWLRDHEPALYGAADRFLLWGDMVGFMLGCEPVTSYSHANRTLLFDIRAEDWSERMLELTAVSRDKLGRTAPGGFVAGEVAPNAAERLGLPSGVEVVVGGHDQCCNSLGAGVCEGGRAVCGIGSFECIAPTYERIPETSVMLENGLNVEHHVLPGLYVSFVYNQAGTLVKWFRDTFAAADRELLGEEEDIYDALAGEMPPGPTRILTLPYFETTGPPDFVADAAGAIVGLRTSTTRGEILKSIMESVTFYFVDSLKALREMGIDTSEFVATGGGARSDAWLQIKADILGVPVVRPRITEGSMLGAAMLAGIATGVFAGAEEGVGRFVQRERTFEPDPGRHRLYAERFERYRELFPRLRDLLTSL